MARQPSLTNVPVAISANNENDLTKKMIANNLQHKKEFNYFDIQQKGTKWVAWYYFDFNKEAQKGAY